MIKAVTAAGAAAVAFPLLIIVLVTASPAPPAATAAPAGLAGAPTALAEADIPPAWLMWYMDAAQTCPGLPWSVLAGIGEVESGHGRSPLPGVHSGQNSAGAEGPMQFEPATFSEYATGPDRPLSPYDPADAIYTAAATLCAQGARGGSPSGIEQAVFAYNHAQWYVTEVMSWAARYAAQGTGQPASTVRRSRDRVREGPARKAVPVGRGRPGRLRLLRPGLRRLRRRRHPHRPHHLPVAAGRPGRAADPDPAR